VNTCVAALLLILTAVGGRFTRPKLCAGIHLKYQRFLIGRHAFK